MILAGLLSVLLVGCVNVNTSQGWGKHELGPADDTVFSSSKDSQENTDSIREMSSKISGIDKSQNEMTRKIDKTSEVAQDMHERNEAVDKKSPFISKEERQRIYKEK